ncbi:MAG: methylamine utilization protein [Armatimonadetes bacterium]|nr:methylamine utilization protein [Armatimonadota bacterium]
MQPIVLLSVLALNASGGQVTGHVTNSAGKPMRDACVIFVGDETARPLKGAMVDQRTISFIPHVKIVTAGTAVSFPNNDVVFHNVFAEYQAKRFDLGLYPRGQKKVVTFNKPGIVSLLCSIHPTMSAYIYVTESPYYAVTDAKGNYKISGIPSGSYRVEVWHETGKVQTFDVRVTGDGQKDFVYRK